MAGFPHLIIDKKKKFCHSFMYINNYKVSKLLSSSFTCSCHQLLVMLVHPTLLSYIQNMHCSHIFKSRERFAINDFFKPFNKYHSQYFLIIYKRTATAKLYILTAYFLKIYNASIQKGRRRKN